ncbi:hypothetical protein DFH27DRAFT_34963 [Peziza echinospora]|nr:hypothetical protein DFH27DRAFT_34963 [Peziza echinospora]
MRCEPTGPDAALMLRNTQLSAGRVTRPLWLAGPVPRRPFAVCCQTAPAQPDNESVAARISAHAAPPHPTPRSSTTPPVDRHHRQSSTPSMNDGHGLEPDDAGGQASRSRGALQILGTVLWYVVVFIISSIVFSFGVEIYTKHSASRQSASEFQTDAPAPTSTSPKGSPPRRSSFKGKSRAARELKARDSPTESDSEAPPAPKSDHISGRYNDENWLVSPEELSKPIHRHARLRDGFYSDPVMETPSKQVKVEPMAGDKAVLEDQEPHKRPGRALTPHPRKFKPELPESKQTTPIRDRSPELAFNPLNTPSTRQSDRPNLWDIPSPPRHTLRSLAVNRSDTQQSPPKSSTTSTQKDDSSNKRTTTPARRPNTVHSTVPRKPRPGDFVLRLRPQGTIIQGTCDEDDIYDGPFKVLRISASLPLDEQRKIPAHDSEDLPANEPVAKIALPEDSALYKNTNGWISLSSLVKFTGHEPGYEHLAEGSEAKVSPKKLKLGGKTVYIMEKVRGKKKIDYVARKRGSSSTPATGDSASPVSNRKLEKQVRYKVHWKGYPAEDDTWEAPGGKGGVPKTEIQSWEEREGDWRRQRPELLGEEDE